MRKLLLAHPSTPENLSVDSIGDSWVNVNWQHDGHRISRYDVLFMMNSSVGIQYTTNNQTNHNVTGLQPNVEYSFRVRGATIVYGVAFAGTLSNSDVAMTLGMQKG
jgi:hypothetical protein